MLFLSLFVTAQPSAVCVIHMSSVYSSVDGKLS